jgi:hypothetical protein
MSHPADFFWTRESLEALDNSSDDGSNGFAIIMLAQYYGDPPSWVPSDEPFDPAQNKEARDEFVRHILTRQAVRAVEALA